MDKKRGRPVSGDNSDAAINRRRQQTRERMQRLRQRGQAGAHAQPTTEQLQQGEQLIFLGSIEEETAPQTLAQVGLRVQGLTLAQDLADMESQHKAESVDEHNTLYVTALNDTNNLINSVRERPATNNFFRRFTVPANHSTARQQESSQRRP